MTKTCPLPTPAERQYGEIQARIEDTLLRHIYAALQSATEQARKEMLEAGLDLPPPSMSYFAATIHQSIYCTLCGADPTTFSGGKADVALAVIKNSQNIARHYWGADIKAPR